MKKLTSLITLFILTSCNYISNYTYENILLFNNENNDYYSINGRYFYSNGLNLTHSNAHINLSFKGTYLKTHLSTNGKKDNLVYIGIIIDNEPMIKKSLPTFLDEVTIIDGLDNKVHNISIYKITEAQYGDIRFYNLKTDGYFLKQDKSDSNLKIEFYGDSITCGYGIENKEIYDPFKTETENSYKTYASIASNMLNATSSFISASGWGIYSSFDGNKNHVIPNYYNYADLTYNHSWSKDIFIPDIVVINLGTNDSNAYNSIYKQDKSFIEDFKKSYQQFIDNIIVSYGVNIKIIISSGMMKMHNDIVEAIDEVYNNNINNCYRLKFNSLSIGGVMPSYHPSYQMHQYAAEELYSLIKSI